MWARTRTPAPARAATTRSTEPIAPETERPGTCAGAFFVGPSVHDPCLSRCPVGRLCLTEQGGAITRLTRGGEARGEETALLVEAKRQLASCFAGALRAFDLPMRVEGSDFRRAVCAAMLAISFGETRSYGDLARVLHAAAQAVGQACGANAIAVIIACHRVPGGQGLGGYSGDGGIETKVALLRYAGAAGLLI